MTTYIVPHYKRNLSITNTISGPSPWVLTIPQLETNTESSALLPWRSQIPMTVRYKIPEIPKLQRVINRHVSPGIVIFY